MPDPLAAQIRSYLAEPGHFPGTSPSTALLAVVDKCEQMRAESAGLPGGVGHFFADEFEGVIARALGIKERTNP
jgi:hypothetical protein